MELIFIGHCLEGKNICKKKLTEQNEYWYYMSNARKKLYRNILIQRINRSLLESEKKEIAKKLLKTYSEINTVFIEKRKKMVVNSIPLETLLSFNSSGFAVCPFHIENKASVKLYPNNKAYCFGCNTLITPVKLFMAKFGLSEDDAIEKAYKIYISKEESL